MVVAFAALFVVVAFLFGRATRPKVRVNTVPLTFIGLLGRLIWWIVARVFRLMWFVVRLFVSEVSSW